MDMGEFPENLWKNALHQMQGSKQNKKNNKELDTGINEPTQGHIRS